MSVTPNSSPIEPLMRHLADSPFNLASERSGELKEVVETCSIEIEYVRGVDYALLEVFPSGKIRFGVAFAERLWAYAYAYMAVFSKVQGSPPGAELKLDRDPATAPAVELLAWAHDCELAKKQTPWPSKLPRHIPGAKHGSPTFAADEMFLCMGGWALLHEIGHIALSHHSRDASTQEERHELEFEADDWASNWILEDCPTDVRVRIKRAMGAAFSLSVISALEVHNREGDAPTHPDPLRRLLRFLDRHVPEVAGATKAEPTDLVWWAAHTILTLHLYSIGKEPPAAIYDDFRGALLAAVAAIDE